jgi:hypothetical protein
MDRFLDSVVGLRRALKLVLTRDGRSRATLAAMLRSRWLTWREANPEQARRFLRGSALTVLGALLVLMIFYPHGLYLIGVVTLVLVAVALLHADWRA